MDQNNFRVLSKFISAFTEDESLTAKIMAEHYQTIITIEHESTNFLNDFSQMLNRARDIAIDAMKGKTIDGKCWTEKKAFFPLSIAMSETHKEVFCLRFYHGLSEQGVSDRLHLSNE